MIKRSVCVIGLGYIGLPTATVLAGNGYNVVGVDLDCNVVEIINAGKTHIVEPDLDNHVRSAVTSGKFKAFTEPQAADIYIICVPTPFHEGEGIPQPNIDYVMAATTSIAGFLKSGDVVILESTSPVGTTEKIADRLKGLGVDTSRISIAYCPERVLPGKIMIELVKNDRVVGGQKPEGTELVAEFYRSFVSGAVFETDSRTAEMCKLTENSFRDVNIAFANELSMICAKEGINVWNLIELANQHPRVNILQPGAGVGGHCIAVDPWFIVARDPENTQLIRSARKVNNFKADWVVDQIKNVVANEFLQADRKLKIACLGLAFKPDIDDLRESPALYIVESLVNEGYEVIVVEPNIDKHDRFSLATLDGALESADIFAVLVRHKQFIQDPARNMLKMANALDFCGVFY